MWKKIVKFFKGLFINPPLKKEESPEEKALRLEAEEIRKSFPDDIQFPLQ